MRYFAEAYPLRWRLTGPTAQTLEETRFFLSCLELSSGDRLLDLGCGHGHFAVTAARLGVNTVGVDAEVRLLRRGAELAQKASAGVHWVHADMRRLPLSRGFDGVLMLDSFGFHDSPAECDGVLHEIGRVLRPGRRLLLAAVNATPLVAGFCPRGEEVTPLGRIHIARELELSPPRLIEHLSIERHGGVTSYERRQYLYDANAVRAMCDRAGFACLAIYGDYHGTGFSAEASAKIVFVATARS